MFIFNQTNYEMLTKEEKQIIIESVDYLKGLKELKFLNKIKLNNINFYWDLNMNTKNGIMGSFSYLRPNDIYLIPLKNTLEDFLLSTVIHELTHYYQFHSNKLLYPILCIPGIRQFTIEKQAKKNELFVDKIINKEH